VAALGVHQHRVDQERIALPLEPRALGPAGHIGAVGALDHHPFDHREGRIAPASCGEFIPAVEGQHRRAIEAPGSARFRRSVSSRRGVRSKGSGRKILAAILQQVIGAQKAG
jgi:hypothetical protein